MSARSDRSRLALLVRLIAGAALAVAAFEPIARSYYFFPGVFRPGLGSEPAPGREVRWCVEGCASSTWQAHGVRRARPWDPTRPVILAVGDSYTEALHVADDEVFTARLESHLGQGLQVLDIGRSGFSAADYLALAERYKDEFHPRWTVVALKDEDFEGVERGNYRMKRVDGKLALVQNPIVVPSAALQPLRLHAAVYSFAVYRWHQLVAGAAAEPPMFLAGEPIRPPAPPRPAASTLEILAALEHAYEGRVTFVFLARPQPEHTPAPPVEQRFDAACAELALSCVNPRARFQSLVDAGTPPYGFANSAPNSGHLNAAGHAALAEALVQELGRLALL
jgi:lysophospholipase L1-like esterase